MKAEITFVGMEKSPTNEVKLRSTNHGSFAGVAKLSVNGKIFYALVTLVPESVGKVFERKENDAS
jgi:hypothetical protein